MPFSPKYDMLNVLLERFVTPRRIYVANQNAFNEPYDVFLSYRRDGGESMAILLRDRLTAKGYRVFLDVESLNSGSFNTKLLQVIENCTDFIVVLSKNCLDRCANDGDWVRAEIAHALAGGKNIVPVMLRGFEWPAALPDDINELRIQNGVNASSNEYFDAAVDRLTDKFLISRPRKRKGASQLQQRIFVAAEAVTIVSGLSLGGWALWNNFNDANSRLAANEQGLGESGGDEPSDAPEGTSTPSSKPSETIKPTATANTTQAPKNTAAGTTAPTNEPAPADTPLPTTAPTESPATNVSNQSYTVVTAVYTMKITYTGSWKNATPNGFGVATVAQDVPGRFGVGDKLEGDWVNGLIEGPGTYTAGSYQLKGNFIKGLKEGAVEQYNNGEHIGTMQFKNGSPVQ